jgi:hypothetical protein
MIQQQVYPQPARTNEEANRRNALPGVTDADILTDLRDRLKQLVADRPHREQQGERPGVEIGLVNRAIVEIERLRAGG